MRWGLHGLTLEGQWDDVPVGARWLASFASRPAVHSRPDLVFHLAHVGEVPPAPSAAPDFHQGDLLAYYSQGDHVLAHFPRFGQLRLDLTRSTTDGAINSAALAAPGVFEDLLAIGLSPHLRRRGMYLMHAFAASPPPTFGKGLEVREQSSPAVLLVGDIGTGKTTTGLALLRVGWKLLSNDSPILTQTPQSPAVSEVAGGSPLRVLSYPGLLSAYPDTLARFPELAHLNTTPNPRRKILFAAESIYPDVWAESAYPGAIVFPQIEDRTGHALERLPAPEALQRLLPHAVEPWDREMIPAHLALLNQLVRSAPAYRLRLGSESHTIPEAIDSVLQSRAL
jgi:hypothetical protein